MKIYEGDDDSMSIYLREKDEDAYVMQETIYLRYTNDFDKVMMIRLTPLEAQNLSQILKSLCEKTEYFKPLPERIHTPYDEVTKKRLNIDEDNHPGIKAF